MSTEQADLTQEIHIDEMSNSWKYAEIIGQEGYEVLRDNPLAKKAFDKVYKTLSGEKHVTLKGIAKACEADTHDWFATVLGFSKEKIRPWKEYFIMYHLTPQQLPSRHHIGIVKSWFEMRFPSEN